MPSHRGSALTLKTPLVPVVLSFEQQTVVSFCSAAVGGRGPLPSKL